MAKKFKTLKMKKTSPGDISFDVKMKVIKRDKGKCVCCGDSKNAEPNAHFIPRAEGGMGIEENIVTLCNNNSENKCHFKFDFGTEEEKTELGNKIKEYLIKCYPGWNEEKVRFKK